jgi:chromosome segregation ATPase
MSEQDNARQEMERLATARDEWRRTAYEITEQANKMRDNLTEERDIAKADFEKVVGYNTRLQDELDKARAEVERLTRELEQAISERTPHDYGIIKEQRDHYRDRLCTSIKETQEVRTEVEQLKQALHDARLENSGQAAEIEQLKEKRNDYRERLGIAAKEAIEASAEVERLRNHTGAIIKLIRPEPSRLEIAAMFKAAWLSNADYKSEDRCDEGWWIEQADALIAAAKGGTE